MVWLPALIAGAGTVIVICIVVLVMRALKQAGRDEAERTAAEQAARIARRQGEIMAEQREPDDAAQRLDRGTF